MRVFYFKSSCTNSKKAEEFLTKKLMSFSKKNLDYLKFTENELLNMSKIIPAGIVELINPRSKYIVENKIDLNKLSQREILSLIVQNPHTVSYPIIADFDNQNNVIKLIIGFEENEWLKLDSQTDDEYYSNLNKFYKFSGCCHYDEVKLIESKKNI